MEDDIERLSVLKNNIIYVTKKVNSIRSKAISINDSCISTVRTKTLLSKEHILSILKNYEKQITNFQHSLHRDSMFFNQNSHSSFNINTNRRFAYTSSDINNTYSSRLIESSISPSAKTQVTATKMLTQISNRDSRKILLKKYFLMLIHNVNGMSLCMYTL
jgi:hypothetical protein